MRDPCSTTHSRVLITAVLAHWISTESRSESHRDPAGHRDPPVETWSLAITAESRPESHRDLARHRDPLVETWPLAITVKSRPESNRDPVEHCDPPVETWQLAIMVESQSKSSRITTASGAVIGARDFIQIQSKFGRILVGIPSAPTP